LGEKEVNMSNSVTIDGITIINLTGESVNVLLDDGEQIIIPALENKNRVTESQQLVPCLNEEAAKAFYIGKIPIWDKVHSEATNLPDPAPNTFFIVPELIARTLRREDLLVPIIIRDEKGEIIGSAGFSRII